MMTIISAEYGNIEKSSVILSTQQAGLVAVELSGSVDSSGGWRDVYQDWTQSNQTQDFQPIAVRDTPEAFISRNGYSVFALLDLYDLEGKLLLANIPKPEKATAVRAWVDSVRSSFFKSQPAVPPPFTYEEVIAEVIPLLNPT